MLVQLDKLAKAKFVSRHSYIEGILSAAISAENAALEAAKPKWAGRPTKKEVQKAQRNPVYNQPAAFYLGLDWKPETHPTYKPGCIAPFEYRCTAQVDDHPPVSLHITEEGLEILRNGGDYDAARKAFSDMLKPGANYSNKYWVDDAPEPEPEPVHQLPPSDPEMLKKILAAFDFDNET
jgi:hypothetical protein